MPLATLGNNIIDSLVPTIDSVRSAVHGVAGDRQYAVSLIRRSWSGGRVSQGTPTIASTLLLTPPPRINKFVDGVLRPAGLEEEGSIVLAEVSLTFTEAELTGQPVAANAEIYFKITDALGQAIQPRYYTLEKPPVPGRLKGMGVGWQLYLRRIQVTES